MIRKYWPVLVLGFMAILLIFGYSLKDNLNDYLSEKMRETSGSEVNVSGKMWVDSLFNYTKNGKDFQFTLLEFKSNSCSICKRMEPELEKIRQTSDEKINVMVLNIMNQNSLNVMKYFGISAVPAQLLLDKNGKEFFRNYGYIPAEDLKRQIVQSR
ncbi:MAG TPA: thioredoxin family protein [Tangfeifania sp.]|nr:thioredoxin family protein [Tangfeifania sp.]